MPELLAFDQGGLDYIALGGQHPDPAARQRQAQARARAARHRHHRYAVPALIYTYPQPGRPRRRRQRAGADRAAARDRDGLRQRRVHQGVLRRPGRAREPAAAAGHQRSRSDGCRRSRRYDPAAARALLDRFGYKDRDGDGFRETPDGKPLVLVQSSMPDSLSREGDTLWLKNMTAIGLQDDDQHAAVQRPAAPEQGRPADDVQPRLPRVRALGLQLADHAVGQVAAGHQPVALSQRRLRRGVRAVPAHAGRAGAHRARAPDVRGRQRATCRS